MSVSPPALPVGARGPAKSYTRPGKSHACEGSPTPEPKWACPCARWCWRVVGLGVQRCQVASLVVAVAVQPLWWAMVWCRLPRSRGFRSTRSVPGLGLNGRTVPRFAAKTAAPSLGLRPKPLHGQVWHGVGHSGPLVCG